jgi:hypothetical protein
MYVGFFLSEAGGEMDKKIGELLSQHSAFYSRAENIYKDAQQKLNNMPLSPLNEFRYCARAQRDVLEYLASGGEDYDEVLKRLEPGNRALKCAINDTVDFLVVYVRSFIVDLRKQYPNCDIGAEYGREKFLELLENLGSAEDKIARSRGNNHSDRVEQYFELYSREMQFAIQFLRTGDYIEDQLANKQRLHEQALEQQRALTVKAEGEAKASARKATIANRLAFAAIVATVLVGVFAEELKDWRTWITPAEARGAHSPSSTNSK